MALVLNQMEIRLQFESIAPAFFLAPLMKAYLSPFAEADGKRTVESAAQDGHPLHKIQSAKIHDALSTDSIPIPMLQVTNSL